MTSQLHSNQTHLSRIRDLASELGFETADGAFSKPDTNSTQTWYASDVQSLALITPAQILAVTENDANIHARICIVENISPHYIEELGTAWNIDPRFFVEHARNPRRELLWQRGVFEYTGIWDRANRTSALSHHYQPFWHIDGNFEYHGLNLRDDIELDSSPNYFQRHCFRSTWEGVEIITSNCKISYCRVQPNLYLFLVDAPLKLQNQYDRMPRGFRPSLRLPYALNRGGLQLQPLFELRDKKASHYSLFESLKSVFMHEWQACLLFTTHFGPIHAAFPAPVLCYILSSSISQTNLRYLSREIRRISFREIREPDAKINETLHDRREDLVEFFKMGLAETITYVPPSIDEYLNKLHKGYQISMDSAQPATAVHQKVLEDAVELERFLMETFQLLMSSISVQDAKLSVEQGQLSNKQSLRATQLTILASTYVPLSFVTGIFGMNLRELNGSSLSIWVFFVGVVVAAIVTAVIFLGLQIHSKSHQSEKEHKSKPFNHKDDQKSGSTWGHQANDPLAKVETSMA